MTDSLSWKRQIFVSVIKRYIVVITLLSILFGGLVSFGYYKVSGTKYNAESQLVQNDNNYNLIGSYNQFLSSSRFKSNLKSKINTSTWKNYSKKDNYDIALETGTNSPFFDIKVTSSNSGYSVFLANTATKIIIQNMGQYLTGANIGLVSQAKHATINNILNRLIKFGGLGFIVAFVLFFCVAIICRLFVGTISDTTFTQESFRIKNLGTLDISKKNQN
ncbi:hypothetical protein [Lactiplantibacillus plantarum]|uniref:hypothetical protein n=1 Tax=Lactiplantibacillus plantarum TaxID=1590 RepID=UPI003C15F629